MSDDRIVSHATFLERLYEAANTMEQKRLAQIADVTTGSMSRIQSGQSMPSVETLARIATNLNVTVDYLIGLSDTPKPSGKKASAVR
jgi:transcriptional regulator with XRE-family HTH domain